jgi:hypothetical protein
MPDAHAAFDPDGNTSCVARELAMYRPTDSFGTVPDPPYNRRSLWAAGAFRSDAQNHGDELARNAKRLSAVT